MQRQFRIRSKYNVLLRRNVTETPWDLFIFSTVCGVEKKKKKNEKKKQVCKGRGSYRESNHVEIVEWKVKAGGDRYAEIQTVIWCLHIPPPCCFCLIYAGIIWWTDKDLSPPPQITFFHFAALADIAIGRIKEGGGVDLLLLLLWNAFLCKYF